MLPGCATDIAAGVAPRKTLPLPVAFIISPAGAAILPPIGFDLWLELNRIATCPFVGLAVLVTLVAIVTPLPIVICAAFVEVSLSSNWMLPPLAVRLPFTASEPVAFVSVRLPVLALGAAVVVMGPFTVRAPADVTLTVGPDMELPIVMLEELPLVFSVMPASVGDWAVIVALGVINRAPCETTSMLPADSGPAIVVAPLFVI